MGKAFPEKGSGIREIHKRPVIAQDDCGSLRHFFALVDSRNTDSGHEIVGTQSPTQHGKQPAIGLLYFYLREIIWHKNLPNLTICRYCTIILLFLQTVSILSLASGAEKGVSDRLFPVLTDCCVSNPPQARFSHAGAGDWWWVWLPMKFQTHFRMFG